MNLTQALTRAISAYQAGKFVEAEQICQKVTSAKRNLFDGHHILAVVQAALGKDELALASYNRAIALQPNHVEALSNRGNLLEKLERFEEALASHDRALALRPTFFEALNNRGVALLQLKRFDEALESYDRSLALSPNYVEAHYNRGSALNGLRRFDEALKSFDRAIALRPHLAEAFCDRGTTLRELGRLDESLASCDRALALRANFPRALDNRGNALRELKRLDEALASFDRAIALQPNFAMALNNRGNTLRELKRLEEALESYDGAIALQPNFVEALNNRALILQELKRFDEALESGDRALVLQPDLAEAHWNEATLRLLTGDFARGWPKYEWRWAKDAAVVPQRKFPQPLWLGAEEISGKTILLHSEQGFGDTIQFCRYVPLVAARGARVILEVQKPLQRLMTNLAGGAQVIAKGDAVPEFDLQCPLLSLPLAFGTRLETLPSGGPYLSAPSQSLTNWDARLGVKSRSRIGLVWSGNAAHKRDGDRSVSLRGLLSVLDIEATFVSLQKELRADDAGALQERGDILHFGDDLGDFSDTAALISQLDLVISVDTSVAHLAGALGKPVWLLLTYVPDWRWLLDREDSPWYPTARLFRQDETRTWGSVIPRVQAALRELVERPQLPQ